MSLIADTSAWIARCARGPARALLLALLIAPAIAAASTGLEHPELADEGSKTRVWGPELLLQALHQQGVDLSHGSVWRSQRLLVKPAADSGFQYDIETGLTYARARYYDSELGRFISRDVYGGELNDAPSLHRYLYAHANPLRYVDPLGFRDATPEELRMLTLLNAEAAKRYQRYANSSTASQAFRSVFMGTGDLGEARVLEANAREMEKSIARAKDGERICEGAFGESVRVSIQVGERQRELYQFPLYRTESEATRERVAGDLAALSFTPFATLESEAAGYWGVGHKERSDFIQVGGASGAVLLSLGAGAVQKNTYDAAAQIRIGNTPMQHGAEVLPVPGADRYSAPASLKAAQYIWAYPPRSYEKDGISVPMLQTESATVYGPFSRSEPSPKLEAIIRSQHQLGGTKGRFEKDPTVRAHIGVMDGEAMWQFYTPVAPSGASRIFGGQKMATWSEGTFGSTSGKLGGEDAVFIPIYPVPKKQ